MKKLVIGIIIFFISIGVVKAKEEVTLSKCVDGDTAWFISDGDKIKVRFLAIDTPESTNKKELYGKEASEFTCTLLTNASEIEIEYDDNSDKIDKYDRHLVWIFVDGELLQEKIIDNGLGEVTYLYGDYKYTNILKEAQEGAKDKQLGIWSNQTDQNNYLYFVILILVVTVICVFSKKARNQIINKTKLTLKKELKKAYKNL